MDPTANILEQERLARELLDAPQPDPDTVHQLAELVLALHEWRSRGGFDPYPLTRPA